MVPEKWCVKLDSSNKTSIIRFLRNNNYSFKLDDVDEFFVHFPFIGNNGSCYYSVQQSYTEITFEEFEKYILNKQIDVPEDYTYLVKFLKKLGIK